MHACAQVQKVLVQKVLVPPEQLHLYVLTVWGIAMGPDVTKYCR